MRIEIPLIVAAGLLLGGCEAIFTTASLFGSNAVDIILKAEDKVTDETAERVEDLCERVAQEDIDYFINEVNLSMDLRRDGTKPVLGNIVCNGS